MKQMSTFDKFYLVALAIAILGVGAFLFGSPGLLRNVDPPFTRLVKTAIAQGSTHFAIADFDGDLQPDVAMIRVTREGAFTAEYFVELKFSSGPRPSIGILGPAGGLQITPQDVNGDKITDLVVTSLLDSQFVAILLNDGKGNFQRVERSRFPEVGKRANFYLTGPSEPGEFSVALGQNRGTAGDALPSSKGDRALNEYSCSLADRQLEVSSSLALDRAGRAPPLVKP